MKKSGDEGMKGVKKDLKVGVHFWLGGCLFLLGFSYMDIQ